MEEVCSKQLLQDGIFPCGIVEEVLRLGYVHKNGLEQMKGSVDRCLGMKDLNIDQEHKEEERIKDLRMSSQMSDDSIFWKGQSDNVGLQQRRTRLKG